MKKCEVKNIDKLEGVPFNGSTEFSVKSIVPPTDATQCSAQFVEVAPGGKAFAFHYHETSEEIFYIVSGRGVVHTATADVDVAAGDAITFPTGPQGSHVIRNASSTETLRYLDFGTRSTADVVHFPEMKKTLVVGPFSTKMYDDEPNA